jgi:hypothetical protein
MIKAGFAMVKRNNSGATASVNQSLCPAVKLAAAALLAAVILISPTAQSATWGTDVVFDLTSAGTGSETIAGGTDGNGNQLSYLVDGVGIDLTAWVDTGSGNLQAAEAFDQAQGIGVCNDSENGVFFGLFPYSCGTFLDFNQVNRQLDNSNGRDMILLVFSEPVLLQNIVLTALGERDMDLTFYAGNLSTTDLSTITAGQLADIGFRGRNNRLTDPATGSVTYDLTDSGGANALLISGLLEDTDDAFLISELTIQVVPVPASIWLLLSGFAGLAGFSRSRQRAS